MPQLYEIYLPNILESKHIQYLREVVLPPIQNIVAFFKEIFD
jgi:hypothetical protein